MRTRELVYVAVMQLIYPNCGYYLNKQAVLFIFKFIKRVIKVVINKAHAALNVGSLKQGSVHITLFKQFCLIS